MATIKTKNAIFDDEFIFFRYLSQKKAKRSPENENLVKKYEIRDFGGSFDNFSAQYLVKWEIISMPNCQKNTKKSSKNPILVFKRAKTHFTFFKDLLVFFGKFSRFIYKKN